MSTCRESNQQFGSTLLCGKNRYITSLFGTTYSAKISPVNVSVATRMWQFFTKDTFGGDKVTLSDAKR